MKYKKFKYKLMSIYVFTIFPLAFGYLIVNSYTQGKEIKELKLQVKEFKLEKVNVLHDYEIELNTMAKPIIKEVL